MEIDKPPRIANAPLSEPISSLLRDELEELQTQFPDQLAFPQLEKLITDQISLRALLTVSQALLLDTDEAVLASLGETKRKVTALFRQEQADANEVHRVSKLWYLINFGKKYDKETEKSPYAFVNTGKEIQTPINISLLRQNKAFANKDVIVRIHSQCINGDVFGTSLCDCGEQLAETKRMIAEHGCGVVLYLMQEGRGAGAIKKHEAQILTQEHGLSADEAMIRVCGSRDLRDFSEVGLMLRDLGFNESSYIRLISDNKDKLKGVKSAGLNVKMESAAKPVRSLEAAQEVLEKISNGNYSNSLMRGSRALELVRG